MAGFKFVLKQCVKMLVQQVFLPAVYRKHQHRPMQEKLVLFADGHHDTLPQNMQAMHDAVQKAGYTVRVHAADYSKSGFVAGAKHMVSFMKDYAQARYVFLCDYYLPASSCKKRAGTKVIQLWHAGGMFKKFGYDAPEDIPPMYRGSVTANYDLVTVSAPACVPAFAGALGVPQEKVEPLGISRTDRFFQPAYLQSCRDTVYAQYPAYRGKKLVLWAPTFRGNAGDAKTVGLQAIRNLQTALGEDWCVIIKLHPHAEQKEHASNCTLSTEVLMPAVDLLITDFSSIIFDYALLEKPAILFAPDYDAYDSGRGFYLDYQKDFPYPLITDGDALCAAVQNAVNMPADTAALSAFRERFMGSCDGHATERILKRIQSL